jgi:CysZ protein
VPSAGRLATARRCGYIDSSPAATDPPLFDYLTKAFAQLNDPRLQRVVVLSVGLALAVLLALGVGAWLLVAEFSEISIVWLDWLIEIVAGLGIAVLIVLLFPAAVSATIGLFLESVAAAVETRHYPGLAPPRGQSVQEAILSGLKFAIVAILLNLVVLPLYLIPGFNLFVFYALNGYLLGREYYETVALRRLDARQAGELRRRNRWRVFLAGVVITLMLTVPVLNLIAPVIATAFMVHIFEVIRRRPALA